MNLYVFIKTFTDYFIGIKKKVLVSRSLLLLHAFKNPKIFPISYAQMSKKEPA